jgi:triosephosphate isomerase
MYTYMRSKIVAGNWKMNKTIEDASILASEIMGMVNDEVTGDAKVILCVPFPYLQIVGNILGKHDRISLGAQNCSEHEWGAYTGEVSAAMLKSLKVPYVIVGHSERREYFGEEDEVISQKVDALLAHNMTPIYCCGEPLIVREDDKHEALVKGQIKEGLFHLPQSAMKKVIIAYEPVWAIGTGKTATAQQAQVGEQRSFSTVREDALADSRRRCVLARGGQRDCASHNRDAGKSEVLEHGIHCGAGPRLARARETAPKKRTWASPSLPIFSARW